MLTLRLLGVGLLLLGVLMVGPMADRAGGSYERGVRNAERAWLDRSLRGYFEFRRRWYQFVGLILIVGGVIYIIHPPPHLY